jgi:hypothetical protein
MVRINGDYVEANRQIRKLRRSREKHGGGTNQFLLFAGIDGQPGAGQAPAATVAYFDEHETIGIAHDEIDLAKSAAKITGYGVQAMIIQIPAGK